jgi:hypothetical protein
MLELPKTGPASTTSGITFPVAVGTVVSVVFAVPAGLELETHVTVTVTFA